MDNKHCEILVRCSDKERNCIQANKTKCKLMELNVSSGNCIQASGTFWVVELSYLCNVDQCSVTDHFQLVHTKTQTDISDIHYITL